MSDTPDSAGTPNSAGTATLPEPATEPTPTTRVSDDRGGATLAPKVKNAIIAGAVSASPFSVVCSGSAPATSSAIRVRATPTRCRVAVAG